MLSLSGPMCESSQCCIRSCVKTFMILPSPLTPVLDACVLAGSYRRVALISCAGLNMFRPLWSVKLLDEMERALPKTLRHARLPGDEHLVYARQVRTDLEARFPDSTQAEDTVTALSITLPDPGDVHVIQTCLSAGARLIVTENLRDFPPRPLAKLGLQRMKTDDFLHQILTDDRAWNRHALYESLEENLRRARLDPIIEPDEFRRVGLKKFARLLGAD